MKYGDLNTKPYLFNKLEKIKGENPNNCRLLDGKKVSYYDLEVDHIVPRTRGGSDDIKNLKLLYWKDNIKKSDKICDSNREIYHYACLEKVGELSTVNVYKGHLKKGLLLNVKQSPRVDEMPAKIINVNRQEKKVEVQFLDRNCSEFIFYDKRLFLNLNLGVRNSKTITNNNQKRIIKN